MVVHQIMLTGFQDEKVQKRVLELQEHEDPASEREHGPAAQGLSRRAASGHHQQQLAASHGVGEVAAADAAAVDDVVVVAEPHGGDAIWVIGSLECR